MDIIEGTRTIWKGRPQGVIVPYRYETIIFLSRAEHEEFCLKKGRPLSKAKYY